MHSWLTRRQALQGLAVAGSTRLLPALSTGPALLFKNAPFFAFTIGELDAIVVSDGHTLLAPLQPIWAPQAELSQVQDVLRNNFLRTDGVDVALNVLVVQIAREIILIDAGTGSSFGPASGHLPQNLRAIGVQPADITAVILTHAHADHIGGLIDASGHLVFPNATVWIAKLEYDYWMKAKLASRGDVPYRNLTLVRSKLAYFGDDETLFGHIQTHIVPGHTPGHTLLTIRSGADELVHFGDTAHNHVLMFAHPEWTVAFDTDPSEAIMARQRVLADLAVSRQQVFGYHLPWPGLGHVRAVQSHYQWIPAAFSTPSI